MKQHALKILIITEFYPKSAKAEITGGVEARCFYINRHLRNSGCQVKVLARPSTGQEWEYSSFSSLAGRLLFCLRTLLAGLREDFDLVEGTNFITYPIAWLVGKTRRKPVVFWYADVFIGSWVKNVGKVGLLGEIAEKIILKLPVDKYIAISGSTKRKLVASGVHDGKVKVVHCGVDPDEIAALSTDEKKFDICTVSRLVGYKRVEDLVRAVALLKKDHEDISAAVIGQGPEKERLESLAAECGVSANISFLGHLPTHRDVLGVMASSRIYCHPSIVEGFGIVVVEAAALGVPIVVSDIPVLAEVTENGKGGMIFKAEDPRDLAGKIGQLLYGDELYAEKSAEAKKLAVKYSWQAIAEETSAVYEELI